jgi:hypothetical protein
MVEADSQLNLLPVSTLYTYKVFEHIDMLSMCNCCSLKLFYGVLVHLWSQNDGGGECGGGGGGSCGHCRGQGDRQQW